MFDYTNRVVVITGASSGLGSQMAKGFASAHAKLVLLARREERLVALAEELNNEYGVEVLTLKCDVTSTEEVNECAKKTEERFGKVDVLVNCAGASKNNGVLAMSDEEWDWTMDIDLKSVFLVTRAFGNIMKKNNYGRIINIASMYGLVGNTAMDTVAYHTSKGGVVNFTRAVAAEVAKYGMTCNAICPGYFETELTKATLDTDGFKAYMKATVPLGRYGHEGELNSAALFLGAEESSYVTGVILPVDGGYTCV